MLYQAYGPFEIRTTPNDAVDMRNRSSRSRFWDQVELARRGLTNAVGCYVFCIRVGNSYKPWYVGRTNGKDGFRQEVFQDSKLLHYNTAMQEHYKNSYPCVMLLIARLTKVKNKISRSAPPSELEWVEIQLIAHALKRNPNLMNISGTSLSKKITVTGVTGNPGSGSYKEPVDILRQALGLGKT